MKALISALRRTLPTEMRHLKFKDVAVHDRSVTLISQDAEINLLRDESVDAAVMKYLWKVAA
jgi:hypothetical protein